MQAIKHHNEYNNFCKMEVTVGELSLGDDAIEMIIE